MRWRGNDGHNAMVMENFRRTEAEQHVNEIQQSISHNIIDDWNGR
jgi:hypothetical protein